MNCTFALGAMDHEVIICKLVTGELVIGKVDLAGEMLRDVGLIIPREVKPEESSENKFGFYVVPFGFPMAQSISRECLSLVHAVKVFPPLGGFGDVVSMYIQITAKEAEQTAKTEENTNG